MQQGTRRFGWRANAPLVLSNDAFTIAAVRRMSETDGAGPTAGIRGPTVIVPDQPVVARVDYGMIRPEGRTRRGPQK
jgi:hypothetical protein